MLQLDSADGCFQLLVPKKQLQLSINAEVKVSVTVKEDGLDNVVATQITQETQSFALNIEFEEINYYKVGIPTLYKVQNAN